MKTLKSSESDLQHVYSATTASVSLATSIADMATDTAMEGKIVLALKMSCCIQVVAFVCLLLFMLWEQSSVHALSKNNGAFLYFQRALTP